MCHPERSEGSPRMCHPERSEGSYLLKGDKMYYVYILTNKYNKVLYVGITNDLIRRTYEHKSNLVEGFTSKYNVHKLVYYDLTSDVMSAITREKQVKGWTRNKKIKLIESMNPGWKDLYDEIL
jgi:putative endonuclease